MPDRTLGSIRIEDWMSVIKVIIYAMIAVLSLLFLGRFLV